MTLSNSMSLGVETLTLGMIVTFVGLAALQMIVKAMTAFTGHARPKAATAATAEDDPSVQEIVQGSACVQALGDASEEEAAVVAAVVAAASMTRSDEEIAAIGAVLALITAEGAAGARIGGIRRLDGPGYAGMPNLWGLAGRQDIMAGRNRRQR